MPLPSEKSTRHAKLTGEFAEAIVLYWLSKKGYECARVDHTGIDVIASTKNGSTRMGISVQGRSRPIGRETDHINIHAPEKALAACRAFKLDPYCAFVVDTGRSLTGFLISFRRLKHYHPKYFRMSRSFLEQYRADKQIECFELKAIEWPLLSKPASRIG